MQHCIVLTFQFSRLLKVYIILEAHVIFRLLFKTVVHILKPFITVQLDLSTTVMHNILYSIEYYIYLSLVINSYINYGKTTR